MPWSPIPKFPEIVEKLKKSGRKGTVGQLALEDEIMLSTGVTRHKSISRIVELMERLKFISKLQAPDGSVVWVFDKNAIETIVKDESKTIEKRYGIVSDDETNKPADQP